MIAFFLNLFLSVLSTLITWFFTPISTILDNIVSNSLITDIFSAINSFFSTVLPYFDFVFSYTGFTNATLAIIILLFIGNITIPILVSGIKLVAHWWEVLV